MNLIKEVRKKADDQLDFKKLLSGIRGVLVESFDGAIIESALVFIASKIPNEYEEDFNALLQAYVDDDYSQVSETLISRLNEAINIPGLNEEQEAIIFKHLYLAIVEIIAARGGETEDSVGGGGPGGDPDGD